MRKPWHLACPYGHRDLRHRTSGYYCKTCADSRAGPRRDGRYAETDVVDLRRV